MHKFFSPRLLRAQAPTSLVASCLAISSAPAAWAQPVPDATLGMESSRVTPMAAGYRIDRGALRGANLFHSFSQFGVQGGQTVEFSNPAGVTNIFSRVTGTQISEINGILKNSGDANLFLINPNGIIFGPRGTLNIKGSFTASTASSVLFSDGSNFSAIAPQPMPLLTIDSMAPIGLQFEGLNSGAMIKTLGNLAAGKNLTLAAGNLALEGQLLSGADLILTAQETLKARDSMETPFIAQSGGHLLAQGRRGVDIFALNHATSGLLSGGDLTIQSDGQINGDTQFSAIGKVRFENLSGGIGNWMSLHDPIIRSAGDVSFGDYSGASLQIFAGGSVTISGTVTITGTESFASQYVNEIVQLSDGISQVSVTPSTRPTLDIRAGTLAFNCLPATCGLSGGTSPSNLDRNENPSSSNILVANVRMKQPDGLVLITNQYKPNLNLSGTIQVGSVNTQSELGNSADIFIDSRGDILLPENGHIDSSSLSLQGRGGNISLMAAENFIAPNYLIASETLGTDRGGDIKISGRRIDLIEGTAISTITTGPGKAGNITLDASEAIKISGPPNRATVAGVFTANISPTGTGSAGNITIRTPQLTIRDKAFIAASTQGAAAGGNIDITAAQTVQLNQGAIKSTTEGTGKAGNVSIRSGLLDLKNGSLISTETEGSFSTGNAGELKIATQKLLVSGGSRISSNTLGQGKGGDTQITATDSVELTGTDTAILTGSEISGNAGKLTINTNRLTLQNKAAIGTLTNGSGQGGELLINADDSINLIGSGGTFPGGIFAFTNGTGNAGRTTLNTNRLSIFNGAFVYTNSNDTNDGQAGTLIINAKESVIISGQSPDKKFPSSIFSESGSSSDAGNIQISTKYLSLLDGGNISAQTAAIGHGGTIEIDAANDVLLSSPTSERPSVINVRATGAGNAGSLKIKAENLIVKDGAQIFAETTGSGQAGNLTANIQNNLFIRGSSKDNQYTSRLFFDSLGSGAAGNLVISAKNLKLSEGGQISAENISAQQGGNIELKDLQTLEVDQGKISASTNTGQGGNVNINGQQNPVDTITVRNSGKISAEAKNYSGNAGSVNLKAKKVTLEASAKISSSNKSGESQGVTLSNLETLRIDGLGSEITASTESGTAGGIAINQAAGATRARSIVLSDRGKLSVAVTTTQNAQAKAGGIALAADQLTVQTGAEISATATSGTAGNLNLTAGNVLLDQGKIKTATDSGNGGEINLTFDRLMWLKNDSAISATAGTAQAPGKGGNITIKSPTGFILALPSKVGSPGVGNPPTGSDITANAYSDQGGQITIKAQGRFGMTPRSRSDWKPGIIPDPSKLPTNDITAISQQNPSRDGQVSVNAAQLDQGLTQVPKEPRSADIAESCQASGGQEAVRYFEIGRGGLPPRPDEPLSMDLLEWSQASGHGQVALTPWTHQVVSQTPVLASPTAPLSTLKPAPAHEPLTDRSRLRPPCHSN
jgi:filamentous hemagglutinin family protein